MPKTYTLNYELPAGFYTSLVIGAEYYEDEMVQFSAANYDAAESLASVTFEKSPVKGNILKFFYLDNLENLTPFYPPKEITVN